MRKQYHQGRVDRQGNFRDKSRKEDGYLIDDEIMHPTPALVTAWYPKQQTIDVIVPKNMYNITYENVVVYGNFFEASGNLCSPKIATSLSEDKQSYTTIRTPEQKDKTSDKYVLDNHIEALIFKTSVGYAASSFRFLKADSPLLNNAKEGRKISRHDDGSYYIHDEDGNIQFKHPSGLNIRIGNSIDDMDLDVPFPDHEKNVADYDDQVKVKLNHPAGYIFEIEDDGTGNITSPTKLNFTAPEVNISASTKFKVTSPESEMTGNLTVGAVIKAVGDIIADWMTTAISLLSHFHVGNLGFNTGASLGSGGGTSPPSTPPTTNSNGDIIDGSGTNLSLHGHTQDKDSANDTQVKTNGPS
jgi:hypothetical protein